MRIRALAVCAAASLAWLPQHAISESVDIREWQVPWENSRPRDPFVDQSGRVWFVGQAGHYIANLHPETGEFSRYDLDPGTGPHNLIIADDESGRTIWYAGNLKSYIGKLNPDSGVIEKIMMPDKNARDPHTLVFDSQGDIWFTVQNSNYVGKLAVDSGEVTLMKVPTKRSRPYGIVINSKDEPWVVEFGSNKLILRHLECRRHPGIFRESYRSQRSDWARHQFRRTKCDHFCPRPCRTGNSFQRRALPIR